MGARNVNGYGVHCHVLAHRMAWILTIGPTSVFVLHHCDNPPCCNPAHLFTGTQTDNVRDMDAKGRRGVPLPLPGELNPNAKGTNGLVLKIRSLYGPPRGRWARGTPTQREVAALLGVKRSFVADVLTRRWRHL